MECSSSVENDRMDMFLLVFCFVVVVSRRVMTVQALGTSIAIHGNCY